MPRRRPYHPTRRRPLGPRLAIALLIPLGTAGGLAGAAGGPSGGHSPRPVAVARLAAAAGAEGSGPDPSSGAGAVAVPAPLAPAEVAALIEQDFPPAARAQARAVAWCESRLEADVVGTRNRDGTRDWGVFQLNDGGTLQHLGGTPETALDAGWNVAAARRLYDQLGFKPWSCKGR